MAEEREQMDREEGVGLSDDRPKLVTLGRSPGVLVLPDDILQKVAVVMQHNGQDGYAPHRRTFFSCQQLLHFFNVL